MRNYPALSIVINTLNRGPHLQKTLESFRWLKYPGKFEVIVVNGPSTDNSNEVIATWLPNIRAGQCDVANLSTSRNIGICMAQGEIVVFIDDDAIPEPEWLTHLAEAYDDPQVGAAGGFVFDHTGYDFQYKYCLVDRFGYADFSPVGPSPHFSFPKSERFPHLLGCNCSFRRTALLEICGFDEEFEYFLDETDVCLRIIDAGYLISQLPCAFVHHKYAPNNIRSVNRVPTNRYPIVKNKIYFMFKHSRDFHSLDRVLKEQNLFIQIQRDEVQWAVGERLLCEDDVINLEKDIENAITVGLKHGFRGVAVENMIDEEKLKQYSGTFSPYNPIQNEDYRTIVLVSRDFPPNHNGGIATFTKDLAEALAVKGNIVHIVTMSPDINRVDFENGVWIHRQVLGEVELSEEAISRHIPQQIWNWSATALEEIKRIATHRKIDVIEAPIWDCEGVAFLLDGHRWPLVTSLHTTLHFWMEAHPEYKTNQDWMNTTGTPLLALEKELMTKVDGIRANSKAIIKEIEKTYDFAFNKKKTIVIPHGIAFHPQQLFSQNNNPLKILFVGRLESRKGIDVLLSAIPLVLNVVSNISFRIIGDDTLLGPNDISYKEKFLTDSSAKSWLENIIFEGRVNNTTLNDAYASCDIFVAPSRFESFGLIFLEAMREGKPVIGCFTGGVPEVISHNVNGLLVEPDDTNALAEAILCFVQNGELRRKMGEAGRAIFENKFTSEQMAQQSEPLFTLAAKNFHGVE